MWPKMHQNIYDLISKKFIKRNIPEKKRNSQDFEINDNKWQELLSVLVMSEDYVYTENLITQYCILRVL